MKLAMEYSVPVVSRKSTHLRAQLSATLGNSDKPNRHAACWRVCTILQWTCNVAAFQQQIDKLPSRMQGCLSSR
jgi:hypothetical protein